MRPDEIRFLTTMSHFGAIFLHLPIGQMNICITRFGIRIGDRKYLNEYTPVGSVSLCHVPPFL